MIDLLAPPDDIGQTAAKLSILDDNKGGVAVKNLQMVLCDNDEDALNQLFEGEINRTYAAHQLNSHSSRSHAIFTLHIESRSRVESTEKILCSKLHLVDLAGSERTKKTDTSGKQLTEAQHINKSLSFLEQVVLALSDKGRDYIPYRQTTLTNFLRDSLGGNCMTVMVANVQVNKFHLEETISTLKFATRMMKVKNEATVNIMVDPKLAIKRYEKEIRDLKQELAMHDTLANRGRINYDTYSAEDLRKLKSVKDQFLRGEIEEIEHIDSIRMIKELFNLIKNDYNQTAQQIESIKRQMAEDPEKMKSIQAAILKKKQAESEQPPADAVPDKGAKKDAKGKAQPPPAKVEEVKEEPKVVKVEEPPVVKEEESAPEVPTKREAIDKQDAFVEFKEGSGKQIESTILSCRKDIKDKRILTKDLTERINNNKRMIDKLKSKLDSKEEQRRVENKQNELEFDEEDKVHEEIIDEEELVMLKEMKELKRDYRENFNVLKGYKQELKSLQENIDSAKEQLIFTFENWYESEFEIDSKRPPRELNMDQIDEDRARLMSGNGSNSNAGSSKWQVKEEDIEDEDATIYKRAKKSVDELRRARKFEKSIKLK